MLTELWEKASASCVENIIFKPFSKASEREYWENLHPDLRESEISAAEEALKAEWPRLQASRFMEYRRNGNRDRFETDHFNRRHILGNLAVGECIDYRGGYLEKITDAVWSICEESFWGVPAHNIVSGKSSPELPDVNEPVIDLFAAETGAQLARVLYLLDDELSEISPLLTGRIRDEIDRRLLAPFLERDDFWWMGLTDPERMVNNWNPWIISNILSCAFNLSDDTNRLNRIIEKCCRCLDRFLAGYGADGGCDEGTSYWDRAGGSLFDCLELIYLGTGGAFNPFGISLIQEIGRYLYRMHISGNWFVNFADGSARSEIAAGIVYCYGKRIGDECMKNLGLEAFAGQKGRGRGHHLPEPLFRRLDRFMLYPEMREKAGVQPWGNGIADSLYIRDAWLPDLQAGIAREAEGSSDGFFVAFKGGNNNESHNHNDIGSFIVYYNGLPVLIDVGVETYTAKTFSDQRYDIWTMQSLYHNLPEVGGIGQAPGGSFKAHDCRFLSAETAAEFSAEIAGAYSPEAGINSWRRSVRLQRGSDSRVEVTDVFDLSENGGPVILNLMTPFEPERNSDGSVSLFNGSDRSCCKKLSLLVPDPARTEVEAIAVTDPKLKGEWSETIYRIRISIPEKLKKGSVDVMICAV